MINDIKDKINKFFEICLNRSIKFFSDIVNIKKIGIKNLFKNRILELVIFFSLILGIFISIIQVNTVSKEELLSKVEKALINENYSRLSRYITVDSKKVSGKELKPIVDFYKGKDDLINQLIADLRKYNKNSIFTLESKKGILYKKSYLSLNKINISFTSNVSDLEIIFGDEKFILKDNLNFKAVPGTYNIFYKLKTTYGDISNNLEVAVVEDKDININVPASFITLYSNFDDAKVFINGLDTGKYSYEIKNYGPIPKEKNLKLFIEREFPWGKIKSDEINIGDESYIKIDINMVNESLMTTINNTTYDFYNTSFEALNNKDINLIKNATDETKEKVYDYINEKSIIFNNNYEITDLELEIEKSDFIYDKDRYKATLLTNIKYSVFKKILPFFKMPNEASFLLSLEYDEDTWKINDIQKVELLIEE